MDEPRGVAVRELSRAPGVGPSIAGDLYDLGFRRVQDLKGQDPERMYSKLCKLRRSEMDRCVLYVVRCAVYYASNQRHDPALLKWWNWKDREE